MKTLLTLSALLGILVGGCQRTPSTNNTSDGGKADPDGSPVDVSTDGGDEAGLGKPDASADSDGLDGSGGNDGPSVCSATMFCADRSACVGEACDLPWECVVHFDDTLRHECFPEKIPFCGCNGVTFHAPSNCPDRPYDHVGACDDGSNCDPEDVRCSATVPSCPQGQYASVVGGCYGPCVPITSCRCEGSYQCPEPAKNGCDPRGACKPYASGL